jgi:RimJ/RimL family protein N-acetyltransferase
MTEKNERNPNDNARNRRDNVQLRNLGRDDKSLIESYWIGLSAQERRQRFHCQIGDNAIQRYIGTLDFSEIRMVGAFEDGVLKGSAEIFPYAHGDLAELAIIVHPDLRGKRIADNMMEILKHQAKAIGVDTLEAHIGAENNAMKRLAQRSGYLLSRNEDGITARSSLSCSHPSNSKLHYSI